MLPRWLDITSLKISMWAIIIVGVIVAIQSIRHVEKAMLRVFITGFITILCLTCYFYQKSLSECKASGKQCSFIGYKVPPTGSIFSK
ncbi:MAG TPA: hypothetical protein PKB15_05290 [Acidimicrobiia bacterium]|nr:hypothetical protein [Acidimicrobiia bacterium]